MVFLQIPTLIAGAAARALYRASHNPDRHETTKPRKHEIAKRRKKKTIKSNGMCDDLSW